MKFDIPEGTPPAKCRGCDAKIFWVKTPANKNMPVDPDGEAHWGTCPKANEFGKNKKAGKTVEKSTNQD